MNAALTELLGAAPQFLIPGFLVFLRVGAVMFMIPVFGEMMVPARVRLAAAFAFTFVIAPAVIPDIRAVLANGASLYMVGLFEVITGLALGLSLRLILMALQVAATIAAQSTSTILSRSIPDPQRLYRNLKVLFKLFP